MTNATDNSRRRFVNLTGSVSHACNAARLRHSRPAVLRDA